MITLTNDFHGTKATVNVEYFQPLSRFQAYRVRAKLCPYTSRYKCNCYAGALGQKGPNNPLVTFGPRPLLPIILLKNHWIDSKDNPSCLS